MVGACNDVTCSPLSADDTLHGLEIPDLPGIIREEIYGGNGIVEVYVRATEPRAGWGGAWRASRGVNRPLTE